MPDNRQNETFFLINRKLFFVLFIALSKLLIPARNSDESIGIYPFFKLSEGYSLPYVEDVRQLPSPCWNITAGFSYEFFTFGMSARSHFLASKIDSAFSGTAPLATEGHTASLVAHIEGKADVQPIRFVTSVDLGMIWFHEYSHAKGVWSRSRLPVVGLGADFRVAVWGNFAVSAGFAYSVAFEGFLIDAKAYNSINALFGVVYDGGMNR